MLVVDIDKHLSLYYVVPYAKTNGWFYFLETSLEI